MPNQIPKRPSAGHFALGVERPDGIEISVAVSAQALVDKDHTVRCEHSEFRSPVLLNAQRMPHNTVPIPPAPARTLQHLSRHARTYIVEKRPARLHQRQFPFQFSARYVLPIDA